MELHAKLVRSQLSFFKPFVAGLSLEATRKGQDKLGELMTALHRREVLVRDHDFEHFQGVPFLTAARRMLPVEMVGTLSFFLRMSA